MSVCSKSSIYIILHVSAEYILKFVTQIIEISTDRLKKTLASIPKGGWIWLFQCHDGKVSVSLGTVFHVYPNTKELWLQITKTKITIFLCKQLYGMFYLHSQEIPMVFYYLLLIVITNLIIRNCASILHVDSIQKSL